MKKFFCCVALLLVTTGFALAQQSSDISRQVANQMLNHTHSTDAPKEAVFSIKLQIRTHFTNTSPQTDYLSYTSCSAVKIDNHWLLASLACRDTTPVTTLHDIHGKLMTKTVQSHRISGMKVEGAIVDKEDIFVDEDAQLILIRANENNTALLHKLADAHSTASLLIAQNPQTVLPGIEHAYLNRERVGVRGRRTTEVEIEQYNADTKCYQLANTWFQGRAGDPLFVSLQNYPAVKFLTALNTVPIQWGQVQTGLDYKVLDDKAYAFIQRVAEPTDSEAWQRIEAHIVK